jgi:putative DNA primase/helicase
MQNPIEQFRAALLARAIVPPDMIDADGELHRCDAVGKGGKGDAAYILHLDGLPAGGFENHRDGLGWQTWRASGPDNPLTPSERAALAAKIEAARIQRQREDAQRRKQARETAALVYADLPDCTRGDLHPYLLAKGIQPVRGVRVLADAGQRPDGLAGALLIVPMRDAAGALHSLQYIDAAGQKRFLSGGRKQGCYFALGGAPAGVLCIAEGLATGASVNEATGHAVAVAFDAGNLEAAAVALRRKFPCLTLVLCADNDRGTPGNPGLNKARAAASAVGGIVALPVFDAGAPAGASDFNDLHQLHGLGAVRAQIDRALIGGTAS